MIAAFKNMGMQGHKMRIKTFGSLMLALFLAACGGGGTSGANTAPDTQSPVVSGLVQTIVSGNTVNLTATAADNAGVTGYCFKTANIAPLASDPCFQTSAQKSNVLLITGMPYFVWAKDAAGNVSNSFRGNWTTSSAGPCSAAGGAASNLSTKNTICMMTDLGEIVLELDAAKAPITVANFLRYVNDGFYSATLFHRVISTFMIQGGGFTYTSTAGYQQKTAAYPAIVLEKTSTTGLSNLRGSIAMARTSAPNSATSQFFINVVDNIGLDAAYQADGNGYAVFGQVIAGLSVVDQIKLVPILSSTAGTTDQPATPLYIQWAYQLK